MRKAIATEKGDSDRWNLKYVAGGLVDIEFIAQYLQLVHAARTPEILDTSTVARARQGVAARRARRPRTPRCCARRCGSITISRRSCGLCLPGPFDPKAAAPGLIGLLARAADVPDFATLDAYRRRDPGQGARELQAHPRRVAVNA